MLDATHATTYNFLIEGMLWLNPSAAVQDSAANEQALVTGQAWEQGARRAETPDEGKRILRL